MYVRMARFEGGDAASFLMLMDRENGLGLTFSIPTRTCVAATRRSNAMNPQHTSGRRTSVEMYEVAVDEQM